MTNLTVNKEQIPRWFLLLIFSLFSVVIAFILKNAYADIDTTKKQSTENQVKIQDFEKRMDTFDTKLDAMPDKIIDRILKYQTSGK